MVTLDFLVNSGRLHMHESLPPISPSDYCPVPPASVAIGQRRVSFLDKIFGPQHYGTTPICNNTANFSKECEDLDYSSYNWGLSTEANFESTNDFDLGVFASIREHLDYEYHSHYQAPRQRLQDNIIESFLADHHPVKNTNNDDQWIIFTAGCMGAGKTHTLRELSNQNLFSFDLKSFISVDPDEIRSKLPEFGVYLKKDPLHAGEYTGKEAGMLAEILTEEALNRGNSVLVDGSLKNAAWYKAYFESLRQKYPHLRLGIIHVTAPMEDILHRIEHRAQTTGRRIPMDVLMDSMEQVPKSVDKLSHYVDFLLEVDNSSGRGIRFPFFQGIDSMIGGWKVARQ